MALVYPVCAPLVDAGKEKEEIWGSPADSRNAFAFVQQLSPTPVRRNGYRLLGKLSLVSRQLLHICVGPKFSSKRWIVDRATIQHARSQDLLYVDDPEYLDFLGIFFANRESGNNNMIR